MLVQYIIENMFKQLTASLPIQMKQKARNARKLTYDSIPELEINCICAWASKFPLVTLSLLVDISLN